MSAAALGLFCAGAAFAAGSGAAGGVPFTMSYEVPVAPRLARFARFELQGGSWERDGLHGASLSFSLPMELVGTRNFRVELSQSGPETADGSFRLEGKSGSADCASKESSTVCRIRYVLAPRYGAGRALRLYLADPLHFPQRLAVSKSFRSDPIGILTITPKRVTSAAPPVSTN